MIHIIEAFTQGFFHIWYHQWSSADHPARPTWMSWYRFIGIILGFVSVVVGVVVGSDDDWKSGLRWGSVALAVAALNQFVIFAVVVAFILAGPVLILMAWLDLIPSKQTRINTYRDKVAEMKAKTREFNDSLL